MKIAMIILLSVAALAQTAVGSAVQAMEASFASATAVYYQHGKPTSVKEQDDYTSLWHKRAMFNQELAARSSGNAPGLSDEAIIQDATDVKAASEKFATTYK